MPTPDSPPTTALELNSALRAAGTLQQGTILTVTITKQVQTPISNLLLLEVKYSADSFPALPNRLFLKWPVEHSPAPERGLPELVFYRELAPELSSPPIVRCLAMAPIGSERQWLILEDLQSTHSNPPWPGRPSNNDVRAAVAVLAQVHARWWEAPALGSTVGSLHTEASLQTMVYDIRDKLPRFIEALGSDLSVADRSVLRTVFDSSLRPWLRLTDPRALTVAHGDAHTWNFLFPQHGSGLPYLIDWQTWHLDVGARDLAFMIALHWDAEVRRELERPLLHSYQRALVGAGVDNYSFEDLWLDYRRCVVRNLTIPIIFWSRGDPRSSWRYRLDCALAAYRDLNAAELL